MVVIKNKNKKSWGKDEDHNLAFKQTVRDDTLLHGPANLMGPIKYVPFGIRKFTEPDDSHAAFHAALKAWNDKYQFYLLC